MPPPRKILHLDLDAFFCAVEAQRDPSLHGQPFAVGGRPEARGVVASCSYAARRYGVHSAMQMAQALRLCPELRIVSSHHRLYEAHSRQVMAHLHNFSPLVEAISIDEAFLDVSDLRASVEALAREVQSSLWEALALPSSLGAATNKLVAKIANDVGKRAALEQTPTTAKPVDAPMAITVVPPSSEAAFLAPLPVRALWGVGPKTAEKLSALGIQTIGDLARWPEDDLARRFGKIGQSLALRARGIDNRPVVTETETQSISREVTFAQDVSAVDELQRTLLRLTRDVGWRLRRTGLRAGTIKLKLRWSDFTTLSRQVTLESPTTQDQVILQAAEDLLAQAWHGQPVRLIGVGLSNLQSPATQLSLWDTGEDKGQDLQQALDALRKRYGSDVVRRASELDEGETEGDKGTR